MSDTENNNKLYSSNNPDSDGDYASEDNSATKSIPEFILNSHIVDFSSGEERAVKRDATITMPSNKGAARSSTGKLSRSSPIPPAENEKKRGKAAKSRGIPKHIIYIAAVAVAIMALVVTAFFVKRADSNKEYDNYLSLAAERYNSGDYSEALTYLRKASSVKPTDEVYGLIVDCYVAGENYDMALEVLRGMDSSDASVADRIQQIEKLKLSASTDEKVTILGKEYPASTTSLVLNDAGLDNSSLSEIVKLYSLTSLSLSGNNISDFSSLSSLGGLMYLDLSNNSLSDLSAISSFTSLRTLILDGNDISDFTPVYSLLNLTTLSIKGMSIPTAKCDAISAALPGCAVLSETTFSDNSAISLGGASFNPDAESIILSGSGISDISALSACTKLKYLDLSGNSISDLTPLMSIPALETLVLSDNKISSIYPLMGMSSLQCVHLENNYITDITALTALSGLKEVYLSGNNISSCAGISNLNNLETLDLSYCSLSDTVLDSLNSAFSIRFLNLEGNDSLTGNAVDTLKAQLTSCTITGGDYPHIVSVSGSDFLDNLSVLNLSGMGITDISFLQKFKDIEVLNLGGNMISNIYSLEWLKIPADLKELDLSGNMVSDISSISKLRNLEVLNLSGNPITATTPLLTMSSLRELDLTGCNISEADILTICQSLPNCNVIY